MEKEMKKVIQYSYERWMFKKQKFGKQEINAFELYCYTCAQNRLEVSNLEVLKQIWVKEMQFASRLHDRNGNFLLR